MFNHPGYSEGHSKHNHTTQSRLCSVQVPVIGGRGGKYKFLVRGSEEIMMRSSLYEWIGGGKLVVSSRAETELGRGKELVK